MQIEDGCRREVLDILVLTIPACEVPSEGGLRRIIGHEHEVTRHGLRHVSCPCGGVHGHMDDAIKGKRDSACNPCSGVVSGKGLGNVVERLGEGDCLCVYACCGDEQQSHHRQEDQRAHTYVLDLHCILSWYVRRGI